MAKRLREPEGQHDVEELCSEVKRLQTGAGTQVDWGVGQPGQQHSGPQLCHLQEATSSGPQVAASSGQSVVGLMHEHGDAWTVYHEFNLMLGRLHLQRVQRRAEQEGA